MQLLNIISPEGDLEKTISCEENKLLMMFEVYFCAFTSLEKPCVWMTHEVCGRVFGLIFCRGILVDWCFGNRDDNDHIHANIHWYCRWVTCSHLKWIGRNVLTLRNGMSGNPTLWGSNNNQCYIPTWTIFKGITLEKGHH